MKLHDQITQLKQQGKSNSKIVELLHCSTGTLAYHLYPKSKRATQRRAKEAVRSGKKKEYHKQYLTNGGGRARLSCKITQFHRLGNISKIQLPRTFSLDTIINQLGPNPKCYLTGEAIDLSNPGSYSLDHKLPVSKGGQSVLDNLGLCTSEINRAKNDKTPEEFIQLCKKVLEFNGYFVSK